MKDTELRKNKDNKDKRKNRTATESEKINENKIHDWTKSSDVSCKIKILDAC